MRKDLIILPLLLIVLSANAISFPKSSLAIAKVQSPRSQQLVQASVEKQSMEDLAIIKSNAVKQNSNDMLGNACIIGGALVHLTFGTMYCWGNFLSYVPSHLKFFSGVLQPGKQPDALYIIPFTIITQALAMPFGPLVSKRIGNSMTLLLGGLISASAVYAASYQTRLSMFMLFYSFLFGAGIGIAYTAPMAAGWKFKPNNRGLVSGGILAGFGSGGFLFSLMGSKIVNPAGLNAVKGVFPTEVYDRFPTMLRRLAVVYAIFALCGSLMIREPIPLTPLKSQPLQSTQTSELPGLTVSESLQTPQFWLMWLMVIASATAGLNTAAVYKLFASTAPALTGDSYQTMVGGMGAIINGVGRIAWGVISDKIGFKNSFRALTILQMFAMVTYPFSAYSKLTFALNTCVLFFCLAGNFALMPPATQKMFGPKYGAILYGMLFSAFAIASVMGGALTKMLSIQYGWNRVFHLLAGLSLLANLLLTQVQPIAKLPFSSV